MATTITNGKQTVKLYSSVNRGKPFFQLAYYEGGRRVLKNFSDKGHAKRIADQILCGLATDAKAVDALATPELESLVAALKVLAPGYALHVAVEEHSQTVAKLGRISLREAAEFFLKHNRADLPRLAYSYDADGNRTSVTYPSGKVVTYDYTSRNQVYAIGVYGTSWAEYAYDGNGHVVRKDLADGTAASYSYDAANRLTTLNHTLGGTSFARFDYGYDSVNRRTYEKRNSAKGDVYTYDAVDQVASVNYNATNPASGTAGANKVQGFTYDAVGNRAETTDSYSGNSSYTANADNEYTAVNGAVYTYGLDGNMLTMGNAAYAYDADNRMTSALVGIVTADDFSYDSRNRVVERTVNGVATFYIYDGWDLIEERNASGTVLATYVHGVTQDEMLSRTTPSGTVFYHANGLGSVSALTNSTGAVVEKYTYDAFGAPAIYNGSGTSIAATAYGNRFLFTGREYLAELKLYDYRNRVYCAGIGRFLQTDPMRLSAGDVNIYRYCGNNPLNKRDAMGLCGLSSDLGNNSLNFDIGDTNQNPPSISDPGPDPNQQSSLWNPNAGSTSDTDDSSPSPSPSDQNPPPPPPSTSGVQPPQPYPPTPDYDLPDPEPPGPDAPPPAWNDYNYYKNQTDNGNAWANGDYGYDQYWNQSNQNFQDYQQANEDYGQQQVDKFERK